MVQIIDYWAPWCQPCRAMEPVITKLEQEFPDVEFKKINVDDYPEITEQAGVMSIPTYIIEKDGEEIYREVTEGKNKESVHLENWPEGGAPDTHIIENMKRVRAIVETALSLRSKKGIKVRQPLQSISIKEDIADEYKVLICDEVNVKEVIYNASLQESVMLNTEITSELKTEGQIRDIIRSIQDLRKEKSFKPGERANLFARADGEARDIFDTHAEKIKKSATLDEIRFADNVSGEEIIDGDIRYTLEIRK